MKSKLVVFSILLAIQNRPIYSQVNYFISNHIVSKYIPKSGTQIGKGLANQSLLSCSYKNLGFYFWVNHGFPDDNITETDIGITHHSNISEKFLSGKLSYVLGFHKWFFPMEKFDCNLIEIKIVYYNFFDINLLVTQLVKNQTIDYGTRIYSEIVLPINISNKITLSPLISSAYHFNFFGMSGIAHSTIALQFRMNLKRYTLNGYINNQFSSSNIDYMNKNFIYYGFGIELYN